MTYSPSPEPLENPIPFTPVPCTRRNGWTAAKQRAFIHFLSQIGLVGPAVQAVGMSRQSAYRLRERAEQSGVADSFADAWDAAVEMGQDNVEDHAITRALEGYEVPYFYGGRQRGVIRRYDNRLLLAALARADRRAERIEKEAPGENS